MDWIYDIEVFPNTFTMAIGGVGVKESYVFEISDRKNEYNEFRKFLHRLHRNGDRMIGFNNIGFDYPVIHHMLKYRVSDAEEIYNFAMDVITVDREDRFKYIIPDWKQVIPQVDLFKIKHFDNVARATSLKIIEFNMRSPNIEDLPFPVGATLTDEQKDVLIEYNKHDVKETFKFYQECLEDIAFRETLGKKYGMNLTNHNDTKIGKDYFIMKLEESEEGICYTRHKGGRRVRQTKRDSINLGEVVFPYVKFERPEFQAVMDWLMKQTITETKGVFNDIPEENLGDLAKYCHMIEKKKKFKSEPSQKELDEFYAEHPLGWVEERLLKSGKISHYGHWRIAPNLNTIVDGFQYDFGTGGIHGATSSSIYDTNEDVVIVSKDVKSYYPNLAIVNRVYPEHLSELFCDIYQEVYEERQRYPKGSSENAVMKLALNGTYGASNDKYSPFYDPKFTMAITINGQLSLCQLAEKLVEVEGLKVVMINTDGLEYVVPHENKGEADEICKDWEHLTGLILEGGTYERLCIRDVNNYIGIDGENGSIKRKGAYQHEGLGHHQNQSALVVKMAAEDSLLHEGDVRRFITGHDNKWDFMLRAKIPRSSRLVTINQDGDETPQQNICRYYISTQGKQLMKIMPPLPKDPEKERYIGIDRKWLVKVCNDIEEFSWDIDYEYYIEEAEKLVESLMGPENNP